jgi:hypothetical protein
MSITTIGWSCKVTGPILTVALAKTPVPVQPEPLLVVRVLSKVLRGIDAISELMTVRFDPVSTIRTAGFPATSTLTRTNPNTRLFSKGISLRFGSCEKARILGVSNKRTAVVQRSAILHVDVFGCETRRSSLLNGKRRCSSLSGISVCKPHLAVTDTRLYFIRRGLRSKTGKLGYFFVSSIRMDKRYEV